MATQKRVKKGPQYFMGYAAVPLYLISAYVYSELHDEIITDKEFDKLCRHLERNWDRIDHPHKDIIEFDSLESSTCYYLDWGLLPERIKGSARQLLEETKEMRDLLS